MWNDWNKVFWNQYGRTLSWNWFNFSLKRASRVNALEGAFNLIPYSMSHLFIGFSSTSILLLPIHVFCWRWSSIEKSKGFFNLSEKKLLFFIWLHISTTMDVFNSFERRNLDIFNGSENSHLFWLSTCWCLLIISITALEFLIGNGKIKKWKLNLIWRPLICWIEWKLPFLELKIIFVNFYRIFIKPSTWLISRPKVKINK